MDKLKKEWDFKEAICFLCHSIFNVDEKTTRFVKDTGEEFNPHDIEVVAICPSCKNKATDLATLWPVK